ncbi:MAG: M15 family metallopeptidase [Thermoflexibacteraceae bacterium]|jgi:D-alanyl-D-alanine dipeptidase
MKYALVYLIISSLLFSFNFVAKTPKKLYPTAILPQDTTMVELITLDKDFVIDVKYATKDNFTGQVLYDCDRVWLRKVVAMDLLAAHKKFKEKGYRIKIYDGYRPISVQWRLWKATPKKGYVSHPTKGMRMHNRGAAVDMTLIDRNGKELDMGTPYDFFGKEAHTTYTNLPAQVLANRKVLKEIMQSCGFVAISNEWWHFDYKKHKFNIVDTPMCK